MTSDPTSCAFPSGLIGRYVIIAPRSLCLPVEAARQCLASSGRIGPVNGTPLDRLRALCLALPEATERVSHGEPTWFVRGKQVFVMYADVHHDDRVGFWCAAALGEQEAAVGAAPERYFRPPYVGGRGWLGVRLDVPVDWEEIAEIVREAYRQIAPKKLVREMDA